MFEMKQDYSVPQTVNLVMRNQAKAFGCTNCGTLTQGKHADRVRIYMKIRYL